MRTALVLLTAEVSRAGRAEKEDFMRDHPVYLIMCIAVAIALQFIMSGKLRQAVRRARSGPDEPGAGGD
ncbi:MAG: hypothetical protein IRZ33_11010 [Alicyclobacillaceae bacterium]|nr:hypothetical protein [Alicyclobacillaceae bacterium]